MNLENRKAKLEASNWLSITHAWHNESIASPPGQHIAQRRHDLHREPQRSRHAPAAAHAPRRQLRPLALLAARQLHGWRHGEGKARALPRLRVWVARAGPLNDLQRLVGGMGERAGSVGSICVRVPAHLPRSWPGHGPERPRATPAHLHAPHVFVPQVVAVQHRVAAERTRDRQGGRAHISSIASGPCPRSHRSRWS